MLPLRVKAVQPPPGTKRLYAAAGLGFGGLVVLTLATFVVCLGMGRVALAPGRVLAVLLSGVGVGGPVEALERSIVLSVRLPRTHYDRLSARRARNSSQSPGPSLSRACEKLCELAIRREPHPAATAHPRQAAGGRQDPVTRAGPSGRDRT